MSRKPAPLVVSLPEGLPVYTGRLGRYVAKPGALPVSVLHNDWDIFWVRQGVAIWELKDGKQLLAGPDEFALLPPFTPATTREARKPLIFHHCHFDFAPVAAGVAAAHRAQCLGPGPRALVPLAFSRRDAPGVWRAYRTLARLDANAAASPWALPQAVAHLIAALAAFALQRTRSGAASRFFAPAGVRDERVRQLQQRINAEPSRNWRVSELADSVELSPGHLHELCRAMLGKSLKRYIVEARLQQALKLLREYPAGRKPSVKATAAACGFSTQHFFSRQFKAYFGVSPLQYRDATVPG